MDVQTAATLADLRQQLDAARAENKRWHDDCVWYVNTLAKTRCDLDSARREIEFMRGFANNPDLNELRDSIAASQAREEAYRADVVRLTAQLDASRKACNDTDLELAKAMSRADVLAAEVKAWHAWDDKYFDDAASSGDKQQAENHLDACIVRTVDTNALDPAKFEGKP
jgi:hypothetical protein